MISRKIILDTSDWCPIKRKERKTEEKHKEGNVEVEAETGGTQLKAMNAEDFWQTPEQGKRRGIVLSSEPPEGIHPADTLISDCRPPELRENKFVVSYPVSGDVLHSPMELIY